MLNKLKQIVVLAGVNSAGREVYIPHRTYKPEPPLGFVSRKDPNFYFLQKKF